MDHNDLREDNLSEETKKLISSLPKDKESKLCMYQGCWYNYNTLQAVINFQNHFQPQDTDIILASFPKSGTTWLKALTVALLERSKHKDDPMNHPLLSNNPHGIVPFFENNLYLQSSTPDLTKYSSSSSRRLFSTHMPLHTLQEGLKKGSPCKVVYICRNAKDVLISLWYYKCKFQKTEATRTILESMLESFCRGVSFFGPIWDHVLSYWRGSLEDPSHVLFLKYEDMKEEPCAQLKRLAEFLGCPFTEEEEESGGVDKILELCSLRSLSGLEINKTGTSVRGVDHKFFFRKGEVGDWKNHLTPEMESKLDMVIETEWFRFEFLIRVLLSSLVVLMCCVFHIVNFSLMKNILVTTQTSNLYCFNKNFNAKVNEIIKVNVTQHDARAKTQSNIRKLIY